VVNMKKTIYPHEIIGEEVIVVKATNASNIGLRGKIVDETKVTLKIDVNGQIKTLFKKDVVLQIKNKLLFGVELAKRPENRLKGK
jgi:ribonuclease P protein subunit POP4